MPDPVPATVSHRASTEVRAGKVTIYPGRQLDGRSIEG